MPPSSVERQAIQKLRDWNTDPCLFARENFHVDLDPWQEDVLAAIAKPGKKRVGMQAAVGVGKSAVEAMGIWHFLSTNGDQARHEGKFPIGYALSISGDNLKSGLWKELAVWQQRSPFLMREFEWTAEKVFHKAYPGLWWIQARTFPKSAAPEAQGAVLSGLHSPWIMVTLDEVGEMPVTIGRRAEQALSDRDCEVGVVLAAFNPTSITGLGYAIAARESGWTIIPVTGDPDDPRCSSRVDKEWAREQIRLYGRDNPWVMAHILGKFPPGGINTLLSPDEVREAMGRGFANDSAFSWAQKRLGVDVARFGDDRTVIFPRQGLLASPPTVMRNADTNDIAARVGHIANQWGSELEIIDDTGHWGHGVYDQLRASGRKPVAVQFHAPAADPRFANRRAEGWMKMAEAVKAGLALPNLPELIPELTQVTYSFNGGKFQLEDKDLLKKRLGFSPDIADALAITYMMPELPAQAHKLVRPETHRAATKYNPIRKLSRN